MKQQKLMLKLKKASSAAQKKDYIASIKLCKELLKKSPNTIPAYKLLATNYIALNRYDEVEMTLKKVISLCKEEESYQLQHLLGCNYISQSNNNKALEVLETLFNKTGDSKVLLDIALSYFELGNYEAARGIYLKLIELEPDNHQAKFNLYPILLYFKDYKNAWVCFHSRLERQEIKDQVHWFAPQWNGESIIGKNILIYPEQGIGDNLYYTICFSEAIADAKQADIVCDNRLKALYQHNFPTAAVHSYDDVNAAQKIEARLDVQVLAGSLLYLYRNKATSFSKNKKLTIEKKVIETTNQYLSFNKIRIGISWFHGRINDGNEHSMYLEELLPLLKIEGIEWVNLQFGEWHKEVKDIEEKHGIPITHVEECSAAGDFYQYGSLIANLDLVISASNAAFMLASRLGVKTWMFLPGKEQGIRNNNHRDFLSVKEDRVFYKGESKGWGRVIEAFCDELSAFPELSKSKELS